MAIKITCPKCGKSYQVKDEVGGKKFRCKGCQGLIPVPLPKAQEVEDDWTELIEEPVEAAPPRRRQRAEKKKSATPARAARKRGRRELPSTVIGSAVLCALGAAFWFFVSSAAIGMLQGPGVNLRSVQQASGFAAIPIAWGSLDVIVLLGVLFRLNAARILGIAIDALGLLGSLAMIVIVIVGVIMLGSELQPGQFIRWGAVIFRIITFGFFALMWFIDLQLLRSAETVDYVTGD